MWSQNNNFIHNYISNIDSNYKVLFGGFIYDKTKSYLKTNLRGKYGLKYEQVDAEKRNYEITKGIIQFMTVPLQLILEEIF